MSGEILPWPHKVEQPVDDVLRRIEEFLAILYAIDNGELLAALPDCTIARDHHKTALKLLVVLERNLASWAAELTI